MSHSSAELLGYQDCGLQAILYLMENTDIDVDSPVVLEIVKLLISKMTRTLAADRSTGTVSGLESGFDPIVQLTPSLPQAACLETQEPCCVNDHHDDAPPWSRGCTRALSDGSGIRCDEDRRTAKENSSSRTSRENVDDNDLHEFGEWLTLLASDHPEIARTLCEVAELIDDEADEQ